MNKTKTIKTIKLYLSQQKDNEILKDVQKETFMISHYKKSKKFQDAIYDNGFSHFVKRVNPDWPSTKCWFVVDKKNNETSVSPNFDIKVNKRKEVNNALRNCIVDIILEFRNNVNWGVQRCELSNKVLYNDNTHIDHYNLSFKNLVKKWMEMHDHTYDYLYNFIYREKSRNFFTNQEIENSFIEFHNKNTNLRAIHKSLNTCNLND